MKPLKMFGLVALAATALMAFAGSAPASPVLTSPAGAAYSGTFTATASSSLLMKAGFANITCTEFTVAGNVSTNNTTHASGNIEILTYSNCGSATVHTLKNGSLTIAPGGAVSGSGSEVTFKIGSFSSCNYGTKTGTPLGTLKGGHPAVWTVSANLPLISGGFHCGNPMAISSAYTFTSPTYLYVH